MTEGLRRRLQSHFAPHDEQLIPWHEFATVSDLERAAWAWAWRRFTQAAVDGLDQLPPDRWFRVRYEHVVTDPDTTARALGAFLRLRAADIDQLQTALHDGVQTSVGRWEATLSPQEADVVSRECGPLLGRLGYE